MRSYNVVLALAAFLFLTAPAQAVVVHDNGPVDPDGGWRLDFRNLADDFTFLAPTSFNTVRFWAGGISGRPLDYDDFISWQIYDNGASGHPGNLLASGTANPVGQFVATGNDMDVFVFEFSIPEMTLSGTNFLALHAGPLAELDLDNNFLWAVVADAANPNAEDISDISNPAYLPHDLAFQLLQVPEPASAALLGAGILAIGMIRRRQRR